MTRDHDPSTRLPSDNEASECLRYIENICTDKIASNRLRDFFGLTLASRINAIIGDYWAAKDWKGNDRG